MSQINDRVVHKYRITDSIELISSKPLNQNNRGGRRPQFLVSTKKPLVVLSTWIQAKQSHINKYVDLYLRKGFDVLTVQTSYSQLLFPKSGFIKTSSDVVDFLEDHPGFEPIVSHSMSVGMGPWCQVEKKLVDNKNKYKNIITKVKGQIWDSVPAGPKAGPLSYLIFQKDGVVRRIGEMVIDTLLFFTYFFFHRYLINTTALLFDPPIKAPNLLFISKDDMIGRYEPNMKALEKWNSMGIKSQVKCWEKSVHVSHFLLYPGEYENEIDAFLKTIGINNLMDEES